MERRPLDNIEGVKIDIGPYEENRFKKIFTGWHWYSDAPEEYGKIAIELDDQVTVHDGIYYFSKFFYRNDSRKKTEIGYGGIALDTQSKTIFIFADYTNKSAVIEFLKAFSQYASNWISIMRRYGLFMDGGKYGIAEE